jgi:hypothetical protein
MPRAKSDGHARTEKTAARDDTPAALDARSELVLELQRQSGNRAVAELLNGGAKADVLARQPTTAPAAPASSATPASPYKVKDVNEPITETISHAPAAYAAWNGTYSWRARWRLRLDMRAEVGGLDVIARLSSSASATVRRAWENAIVAKWSNKFAFCVLRDAPIVIRPGVKDELAEMYPIRVLIVWETDPRKADYVITPNAAGATASGRAGVGGTTSMTGWGTADTLDITHEFGHMLGCPEEYFTTNGVDYTEGGRKRGFRDPGGGVMNNPAGPALARNFEFIRKQAAGLRGVPLGKTVIRPWR